MRANFVNAVMYNGVVKNCPWESPYRSGRLGPWLPTRVSEVDERAMLRSVEEVIEMYGITPDDPEAEAEQ